MENQSNIKNPDNPSKQIVKKKTRVKLKNEIPELTEDNIESVFNENFNKINLNDDTNYNTFLNKKEILNRNFITNHEEDRKSVV